jgi:hypothetical protein
MAAPARTPDRRQFLQHSLAAVGLGAAGSWGMLRDAVLRARESQRPVLTEEAVNNYIRTVRSRGARSEQAFVTAVRNDVRAFVRNNFTLTTQQDRGLAAFTATDVSSLVNAVSRGVTARNELVLRLTGVSTGPRAGTCRVFTKREAKPLADGTTAEVWTIAAGTDCPPYMC